MRQYEPIWNKLKKTKQARIKAEVCRHATIKKAVIKEKDNDLAYKLELTETKMAAKLEITSEGKILTFKLVVRRPLKHLTPDDL